MSEHGGELYSVRGGREVRVRRWFVEVLGCPRCGEPVTPRTLTWGEGDDVGEVWIICRACATCRDASLASGHELRDTDPRDAP